MASRTYDFTQKTRRNAASRVGFRCSVCDAYTVGPKCGEETGVQMHGEGGHIVSPAGPRSVPDSSREVLRAAENCIWLCMACHRTIDTEESLWTTDELRLRRQQAEELARWRLTGKVPPAGWDTIGRIHAVVHSGNPDVVIRASKATAWLWLRVRHVDVPLDDQSFRGTLTSVDHFGVNVDMQTFSTPMTRMGRTAGGQFSGEMNLEAGHLFLPISSLHTFAHGAIYVQGEVQFAEDQQAQNPAWSYRPV